MKKQIKRFVALLTMLAMVFGGLVWNSSVRMQAAGCSCAASSSDWNLASPFGPHDPADYNTIRFAIDTIAANVRVSSDGGYFCICGHPSYPIIGDDWVTPSQWSDLSIAITNAIIRWNAPGANSNNMANYIGPSSPLATALANFIPQSGNAVAPTITTANSATVLSVDGGTFHVAATGAPGPYFSLLSVPGPLSGYVSIGHTTGLINILANAPVGEHSFTVRAYISACTFDDQPFTLNVHRLPTIISDDNWTMVLGETNTFNIDVAGGPLEHFPPNPLTFALVGLVPAGVEINPPGSNIIRVANTTETGPHSFSIEVASSPAGTTTQTFALTVHALPAFTSPATHTVTHTGSNLTFNVTASGFPAPTITTPAANLPTGVTFNGGVLTITPTATTGVHTITFTATNNAGGILRSVPQNFTLTVTAAPVAPVFTTANNTTIVANTAGEFPVTATGATGFSLTGAPAGVTISANGLMTISARPVGSHTFTITATNAAGQTTQTFTLNVVPATVQFAPQIQTHPVNQTVTAGQNVTFTAAALGNPVPELQWQVSTNGGVTWSNIGGATTGTLTLTAVTMGMNNNLYRLRATNIQGAVYSNAARLTVNPVVLPGSRVVTIADGGLGSFVTGGANHLPGSTVTVNPGMRAGYLFDGWTFNPSVTFATGSNAGISITRFVMPNADVTATVRWVSVDHGGVQQEEPGQVPQGTPTGAAPGQAGQAGAGAAAPSVPQQIIPAPSVLLPPQQAPGAPAQAPGAPLQAPGAPMQAPAWQGGGSLFDDVWPGAWYYSYIETAVGHGLFQGTGYRIFSPQVNMTRGMFAQVLANLQGADLVAFAGASSSFTDVSTNAWYFAAVEWAAQMGIVLGVGEGQFAPNMQITREQMAVMLYRYVQFAGMTLPQGNVAAFADQNLISPWASDAVAAMQAAGIVTGRGDNRFDPQATATRAEVAAVFARFLALD